MLRVMPQRAPIAQEHPGWAGYGGCDIDHAGVVAYTGIRQFEKRGAAEDWSVGDGMDLASPHKRYCIKDLLSQCLLTWPTQ